MAFILKELLDKPEKLTSGHRLCPGCGAPILAKWIMMATDFPLVVANATGCLEVSTTIYPYTAWNTPWIHNAFENAAATIAGVESAYKSLSRQGKIKKKVKFIAFGGDGGTYDIGIQALSGALERGHDMVYICYDNEGYMNTGAQRSGATPKGASTTTEPAGKVSYGKKMRHKDLTAIAAAHHIPYAAQAALSNWQDLMKKAKKAIEVDGPAFLNILSPCVRFWRIPDDQTIEISKLAVETNFWPLFEIDNGKWILNYKPRERKPIMDWIKVQGRYKHLLQEKNKPVIEEIQKEIDEYFHWLEKRCSD
ncbi:MAG: pyruvate ferredoxin oxidoreductase [Spirochaetes bacterium]|nr:pyruvate ferredoxin oxidoreductase [Spirochaetota bacterium]